MLENLLTFAFLSVVIAIIGVVELLLLETLFKKIGAYLITHVILYAGVAYWCWNLLEASDQNGNSGIKILFYFSLFVCALTAVILLYYYEGFLFIGRLKGYLKGAFNAYRGKTLPYQILYKDGSVSNILSNKAKDGILWIYEGKQYLVSLYDRKVSVRKAPIQEEKLLLAAALDAQLQTCLSVAGGRRIGNGVYFCIGTPSIAEDATCAVRLRQRGKMLDAYLYEEEVPRGLTRRITLCA